MKKFLSELSQILEEGFRACGYDASYGKVNVSNRPDLCEYQCNGAMAAAKAYKKAPIAIASAVVEAIKDHPALERIEAINPGFINIQVKSEFLVEYLMKMAKDPECGIEKAKDPMTVIVDYGGANVAKPLHIGHLRSAVIGESVKRIIAKAGHRVIGDVHLGDWGLQMGLIIEQFHDENPDLPYFDPNFTGEYPKESPFTISELETIYPKASKRAKGDPKNGVEADVEFANRAHQATVRLQSGDPSYTALWKHILSVSLADLKKNYDNLDVHFDLWKGESDAQKYIPDMIEKFEKDGFAYESQGALVIDVAEESDSKEIPPCIVRKSDGGALYATSDLGTLVEREKDYHPDWYVYLADKRQALHYTQFFRVAKKTGIVPADARLDYIGFGTMNGKDGGPFKTREGGVMRLEQLIREINEAVYQRIMEGREVSEEEARATAKVIGLAALKYGDLSNQATKDYIFDIDRFASFEGNTGPYILYTIVRIKSILAKYAEQGGQVSEVTTLLPSTSESIKNLYRVLSRYNEVFESAVNEIAPHKLCQYIFELSNAFNGFYHETKILAEEDEKVRASYIALIVLTKRVLEENIELLGFSAPEKM
ncbi:MAG: arginine--tRNA ligase [Lachnospiraceae bacterium]|nr:arginine--tRNA ligase [Lachnospiraceae bacterium]